MANKILIADDEELVRVSPSKYIKNHCPIFEQILQADNGQSAVDQILSERPDVVILDVQMPVLTGIDVMRQIKDAGVNTNVIILSGFNEFKYAQQAMHYGAREYFMKPVKASELVSVIYTLLGQEKEEVVEQASAVCKSAIAYIKDHYNEDLSLSLVANKLGLSSSYLSSKFSAETGTGFVDYVNKIRIDQACAWLKRGYYKIYEVAEKVGFNDTKYFTKLFKKVTGITPKKFAQNQGVAVEQ